MLRRFFTSLPVVAAGVCLLLGARASAHMMPALQGSLHLMGRDAYVALAVPASALSFADRDHDGTLDASETAAAISQIRDRFTSGLTLQSGDEVAHPLFIYPVLPNPGEAGVSLVVLSRMQFSHAPDGVVIATDLFGTTPAEHSLTFHIRQDTRDEIAVLTPQVPRQHVMEGAVATLWRMLMAGAQHILTGPDHLLFLLTIVMAGSTPGYWLRMITSFTLAHSITLALSALHIFRLPPAVVEPAIAASIVIMALLNLRAAASRVPLAASAWRRMALVFGCGLIHGMGFASAIDEMGLQAGNRLLSLAGFNLGIEAGQFLFLAGLLLLSAALRQVLPWLTGAGLARAASAMAVLGGGVFFAQAVLAG